MCVFVCVCVCCVHVFVCVCLLSRLLTISGVMWDDMDLICLVK